MRNGELPDHPIVESEMSQKGGAYVGAGEEEIPNEGQTQVGGILEGGHQARLTVQRGKVHRNLAAIRRVVQAGNRVVFDQNERGINTSSIINKTNCKITPVRLNGIHEFDLWVKQESQYGQYGVLCEEEQSDNTNMKSSYSERCWKGTCMRDPFHRHPLKVASQIRQSR